jgi:hypothetical protein
MNKIVKTFARAVYAVALAGLSSAACGHATATLEQPGSELVIQSSTLFPETIEYDARRRKQRCTASTPTATPASFCAAIASPGREST